MSVKETQQGNKLELSSSLPRKKEHLKIKQTVVNPDLISFICLSPEVRNLGNEVRSVSGN